MDPVSISLGMIRLSRRFSTVAPPPTAFREDKPYLLVSWWCTLYALAIIIFRIMGRYIRTKKIFLDDKIMILAIVPLLARMSFDTVVITHGTNNVDTSSITETQIKNRELGSKLVLVSRVLYVVYLWTIKYSISIFLRTLTAPIWKRLHQVHLDYVHLFLLFTLIMTFFAILVPCTPFNHFWQVVPDPGTLCRQNYIQIYTVGSLNIITNIVLVIFPFPMVLMSGLSFKQKLTILLRLSIPVFPVFQSLYSIPSLISQEPSSGSQIRRTLFVSINVLLTAFCANAVVLFSLLQDKGFKKTKFKYLRDSLNNKRPDNISRPSYLTMSVDDMMLEICDPGNLLNNAVDGGSANSDNNQDRRKDNQEFDERICPALTELHMSLWERTRNSSLQIEPEITQMQMPLENAICDLFKTVSREDNIPYWSKRKSGKDGRLYHGPEEVLHPPPVHL